jgi:hypothetical protein
MAPSYAWLKSLCYESFLIIQMLFLMELASNIFSYSPSLVLVLHDLIETLVEVSEDLVKVDRVRRCVMEV